MNKIVVYGGRFMPFHKGHKSVYDHLVKKFGSDSVYVVSSNKQAPVTSPFAFEDKIKMMQLLGVPADHIVQVRSPYQPKELIEKVDGENTSIIFALSAKDAERFTFKPKKNGDPSYMQPYGPDMKPLTEAGYVLVVPTVEFPVNGQKVSSASEIRKMYIDGDNNTRNQILKDLYGKAPKQLRVIFDKQLSITESIIKLIMNRNNFLTESKQAKTKRILDRVSVLEQRIKNELLDFKK